MQKHIYMRVLTHALQPSGPEGGVIASVDYASFGVSSGTCGNFTAHPTCHDLSSMAVVQRLCLGKASCTVPSHADFWTAPLTCPGP